MKKINLLAVVVAGVFAVACNGGSSSGGGSTTTDACSNGAATCGAPAAPVTYNQQIQSGGSLLSTTDLYVSTGSTDIPLSFSVSNITQDTVVTFTVAQSSTSASTNKLQANTLPVLSSNSCTFNAASSQACNLNANFLGTSNGVYTITPSIGGQAMTPITITSMAASSFTLPLGTYSYAGQLLGVVSNSPGVIDHCYVSDVPQGTIFVNNSTGGFFCGNNQCFPATGIVEHTRFPTVSLPSGVINVPATVDLPAYSQYLTNAGWNNNVFSSTYSNSPAQCSGLFATSTMTLQSSSTVLPYPTPAPTPMPTPTPLPGLAISENTNECTYDVSGYSPGSVINTPITFTINGAIIGHQYLIMAKRTWGSLGNAPITLDVIADSSVVTLVGTCEYLQTPVIDINNLVSTTASTSAFAADMTATQQIGSLVTSNNSVTYTVNFIY